MRPSTFRRSFRPPTVSLNRILAGCGLAISLLHLNACSPNTALEFDAPRESAVDSGTREHRAQLIEDSIRQWSIYEDNELSQLSGFRKRAIVEGDFSGQKVEYVTYTFDGLEISGMFLDPDDAKPLLSSIEVTSTDWRIAQDISVGYSVRELIEVLGRPEKETVESLSYCGFNDCMTFNVKNNTVTSIAFDLSYE